MKQSLRLVAYLLVSLLTGITVTLLMDSFENIAVEKRIRHELEQEIKGAAAAFKDSAKDPTAGDVLHFIREYSTNSLNGKIIAVNPDYEKKPNIADYSFLFTYRAGAGRIDYYILNSFLKGELAILDTPELLFGIFTTITVFTLIVLYMEKRKQATRLYQQLEVKHAEFRKVLEEHEALALLGRMVATLAHELKTPLATISNLVQMLPTRSTDERFMNRFVALTNEELNRTQQLISNLLVYGKEIAIDNGEWVAISPLIAELASKNNLQSESPLTAKIHGDRFYLGLLFENLLRNSQAAGADTVRVTIRIGEMEGDSRGIVLVEDDGAGFPGDVDLSTLLAPFITLRSSGAGLGLYLADRIVAAHNGSISLYRLHRGAGVSISLPRERIRTNG